MKTKGQNTVAFILAIVIIAGLLYVSAFGVGEFFGGVFTEGTIRQGLDLAGGTRIVYAAEEGANPGESELDSVENVLRTRLDSLGYTEGTVTRSGNDQFVVEIPGESNTDDAVKQLGSTAKLEFRNADGDVVLEGGDIVKAEYAYGDPTNAGTSSYYISLKLSDSAVDKFSEATGKAATAGADKNYIAIYLDETEISKPSVSEKLTTSDVVITGNYTKDEAKNQAALISSGKLAFALDVEQTEIVTATLGSSALTRALWAGLIGIILVMLFMIIIYRLPGLMAALALALYMALTGLALNIFKVNLSLAGIAGVVLAIGMAVDANVVIFERIKDEIRKGKTVGSSIKAGFHNATSAVLDSNITTIIASIVLYIFGTGSVKGFAVTLLIGVILSFVSAVFVTRFFINRLVGMGITKSVLYGVKEEAENK